MIDPTRVWPRLQGAVDEVDAVFRARAFDPSIHGGDTAAVLLGPDRVPWASGTKSTPFLTALLGTWLGDSVSASEIQDRQVVLSNDPFDGGCSLSDVRVATPITLESFGVAWLASAGHYPDIGGRVPGGVCPDAWDVAQEGIRIPTLRVAEQFVPDTSTIGVLGANTRNPVAFKGNLLAQITALAAGVDRLQSMIDRFGPDRLVEAATGARAGSQSVLEEALASFSPGTYVCRDRLDNPDRERPIQLVTTARVEDGRIQLSFDGSDLKPGSAACPFSAVRAGCVAGLRQLLPDVPASVDLNTVMSIARPKGSYLDAVFPQAVSGGNEVAGRVASGVIEALSQAVHGRGSGADAGGGNLAVLEGHHRGKPFFLRLAVGSGGGASGRGDGLINVGAPPRRGAFPAIEAIERDYPLRILRYERRGGSGGAGRYRGGDGTILEFQVETEARLALYVDRGDRGAGGHSRGARGSTAKVRVHTNGHWQTPPTKVEAYGLQSGDRVRLETAGGGGYGHPYERAIRLLSEDLSANVLTRRTAALQHGVLFRSEATLDYDSAATFKLRSYRLTSADVEALVDEIEEME